MSLVTRNGHIYICSRLIIGSPFKTWQYHMWMKTGTSFIPVIHPPYYLLLPLLRYIRLFKRRALVQNISRAERRFGHHRQIPVSELNLFVDQDKHGG